jgi:hypothetical protein
MHDACPNDRGCLGEVSGPGSVDRERSLRHGLRTVDVVERSRVDDPLRTHLLHSPKDCLAISDVEALMVEGTQVVAFQGLLQVAPQLTACAG